MSNHELAELTPPQENFHAWQDDTGFAYDTMLTKVDTLTNSNERINLTVRRPSSLSLRQFGPS